MTAAGTMTTAMAAAANTTATTGVDMAEVTTAVKAVARATATGIERGLRAVSSLTDACGRSFALRPHRMRPGACG